MKKNVLGLILYVFYFISISYGIISTGFVFFSIFYMINSVLFHQYYEGVGFSIGMLALLSTFIYKLFTPFLVSMLIIKKCKNPFILKIYNDSSILIKIFIILFIIDLFVIIIFKCDITQIYYLGACSFLPIFLVGVVNVWLQKRKEKVLSKN